MKRPLVVVVTVFLLFAPLLSTYQASAATTLRNVSITIEVLPTVYDSFVTWIQPFAQTFHNFTIIVMEANGTYDWYLQNQTRISQLTRVGDVIPGTGYLQTKAPSARISFLSQSIQSWKNHVGSVPTGFFMFQPDTLSSNFLKSQGVSFLLGYCFDQYRVDWMTMRGGWQLPYYANQFNALAPENLTQRGTVILPWLTWDWRNSFTLSHNYNTHPVDTSFITVKNNTAYILELLEANLDAASPFAYSAFSFEYDWVISLNLTAKVSTLLTNIIASDSYEKLSCSNFTQWFKAAYPTTPAYRVNFTSPSNNKSIEWYLDANSRVARMDGVVVSYVNYAHQAPDKFLNKTSTMDFTKPKIGEESIDTSLAFSTDALGGGEFRAPSARDEVEYSGDLSDFQAYFDSFPSPPGSTKIPAVSSSGHEPLSLLAIVGFFGLFVGLLFTVRRENKRAAVLVLAIVLLSLTLSLRGVAPKTFIQTEIPAFALTTTVVTYDFLHSAHWGITDFTADLTSWEVNNNQSSLTAEDKTLHLVTDLGTTDTSRAVVLYRNLSINVYQYPIFSINISVSKGAAYHIRFQGKDSGGADRAVWWENSPLDDLTGKSTYEINAVNLVSFTGYATGQVIPTITSIQVIIDQPYSGSVQGEQVINISGIQFSEQNVEIKEYSGNSTITSDDGQVIQALIINVPAPYLPDPTWRLLWASMTYRLTSNTITEYKMIALSRSRGALIDGPTILTHQSAFTDIYKLELLSSQWARSQQLTFISSLVSDCSIIILKDAWDGADFTSFEVDSIQVTSSKILGGI